jgi:hypothetical protein
MIATFWRAAAIVAIELPRRLFEPNKRTEHASLAVTMYLSLLQLVLVVAVVVVLNTSVLIYNLPTVLASNTSSTMVVCVSSTVLNGCSLFSSL